MELKVWELSVLIDDEDYAIVEGRELSLAAGYVVFGPVDDRQYLHRVIMQAPPDKEVDHRNHNKLDCRKTNLRVCTHQQNLSNVKGRSKYGRGISFKKGAWVVRFKVDGFEHYLGRFQTLEEATAKRDTWIKLLYGSFAHV